MKHATLIEFILPNILDELLYQAIFFQKDDKTFCLYSNLSSPLSDKYHTLFLDIINGDYSFSYIDNDKYKTDYFDFGHPLKNLEEYIKVFEGIPLKITVSEKEISNLDNLKTDFSEFPFNEDISFITFTYREAS